VFDSGIGGLTVVRQLRSMLPNENIIYLGDTAHLPYGTKSVDAIIQFSINNAEFLLSRGAKYLVIACYSSNSVALDILKQKFSVPIIGVIQPGVKKAVAVTRNQRIGVIGTSLTIFSGAYEKEFKAIDHDVQVMGKACPLLVPLVEEGWLENEATEMIARTYLEPLKADGIDTLLLGCTHYPLLLNIFRKIMGKINYVDASVEISIEMADALRRTGLGNAGKGGEMSIYLTDLSMNFKSIGERFLGEPMTNFSRVAIGGI
jgi:glutamate racemase